jgi:hypothetical protein
VKERSSMTLVMADVEVAKEIGINAAIVVNKLNFWHEKSKTEKYGKWVEGVHYVYNTYDQWREQFPWMSYDTVKRTFNKLVDIGLVFKIKYKKGWEQVRGWALNYSHSIWAKCPNPLGQNAPMEKGKMPQCYNTDTYPKKTANTTTHVVPTRLPASRDPYHNSTRSNGELKEHKVSPASNDFIYAKKWLVGLDEIYRDRVEQYVKAQMSNPKIRNPIGYEREVVSEVWRKHMGLSNHCDFVVTMDMKREHNYSREVEYLTREQKVGADMSFDEEMEMLYEQGGIYDG